MKTYRFQNTIFFKGPKLYNLIMVNNIVINYYNYSYSKTQENRKIIFY